MKGWQAVVVAATALATSACTEMCGNEELSRIRSADDALDAVVFVRDCGATTDFSIQVSIVTRDARMDDSSIVFVADHVYDPVATGAAEMQVSVVWQSERTLSITAPSTARVFKCARFLAGVAVTCKEATSEVAG